MGIGNWKKASLDGLQSNNYLTVVGGGSSCKVMYRGSVHEHQVHLAVEVEANPLMVLLLE